MLQGLHNGQQLSTSNTVVPLSFGQSFAEVGHNPFTTILHLGYYTTHPNIVGVGVDDVLLPWLWVTQDGCRTQCLFQCLESGLRFRRPLECPFLFSRFGQWLSYFCESGGEPPVIPTQPQKTPQLLFVLRLWPDFHT